MRAKPPSVSKPIPGNKRAAGSLIGGIPETLRRPGHRFVIDTASLK